MLRIVCVFFAGVSFVFCILNYVFAIKNYPAVRVKIQWIVDKRLPVPTDSQMSKSLAVAQGIAKKKLGVNLEFVKLQSMDVDKFFKSLVENEEAKRNCSSYVLHVDKEKFVKDVFQALNVGLIRTKTFTWKELKGLNPELEKAHTHQEYADILVNYYLKKVKQFKQMRIGNVNLIDEARPYIHSPRCWTYVIQKEKAYQDVTLITNEALIDTPGMTQLHIKAKTVLAGGYGNLISSIGNFVPLTPLKSFQTDTPGRESLFFGRLIVHELGHFLFKFYDTYAEKEKNCVMYAGGSFKTALERFNAVMDSPPCQSEMKKARQIAKDYAH